MYPCFIDKKTKPSRLKSCPASHANWYGARPPGPAGPQQHHAAFTSIQPFIHYSFSWHLSSTSSVLCAILDAMAKTAKVRRKPEVPAGEQAGNACAGTRWGGALPAYWTFPRGSQTLTVGCLKQKSCTQSGTRGSSRSGLHDTSPASHHLRSTSVEVCLHSAPSPALWPSCTLGTTESSPYVLLMWSIYFAIHLTSDTLVL